MKTRAINEWGSCYVTVPKTRGRNMYYLFTQIKKNLGDFSLGAGWNLTWILDHAEDIDLIVKELGFARQFHDGLTLEIDYWQLGHALVKDYDAYLAEAKRRKAEREDEHEN